MIGLGESVARVADEGSAFDEVVHRRHVAPIADGRIRDPKCRRELANVVDPLVAQAFYDSWLDAWNQDDIDGVLAIVTDDFVLSSPTTRLTGMPVNSAKAIRDYIGYIRGAYPDLIFTQTGPPDRKSVV